MYTCIVSFPAADLLPPIISGNQKMFFIPVKVLLDKFKGKYISCPNQYYQKGTLCFSASCQKLLHAYEGAAFQNGLYEKDWRPFIKETFNGFGNTIEYLGRYTHKITIPNSRIRSVTESKAAFSARGRKPGELQRKIPLENKGFIRRFLMHLLPPGFQKIRYYGFLSNRMKAKNLKLIFRFQRYQKFKRRYADLTLA